MPFAAFTKGSEVADAWGKCFTKAAKEGDLTGFKNLFIENEPVYVVLQTAEGEEAAFTVCDDPEQATMTWTDWHELIIKDLETQNYVKSEAQCLGVLGDRMIMEVGRFNTDGEVYADAYMLVTLDDQGKISMVEAFSDVQATNLVQASALREC